MPPSLLDPHTISRLDALLLRSRVVVGGAITGLHRAQQQGASVEFAEHKEYSPGDEVKHLDWKLYAKADRYYVKRFEQESELTAFVVIDRSGSMAYGDNTNRSKLHYACRLAAALSYLLVRQGDRVGLQAFGGKRPWAVPPRGRAQHLRNILSVLEEIDEEGASGDETMQRPLEHVAEVLRRRRALVVLISDLFERGDAGPRVLRLLRARGHDVSVFHTLHDDELTLPFEGMTQFQSLEGPQKLLANPRRIRVDYQKRLAAFLQASKQHCIVAGIDYVESPTSAPLDKTLLNYLALRAGAETATAWNF